MEKTDAEVNAAYKVARKLASLIMLNVRSSHSQMLDFDDFVQEGVLAWLEGRPMYYAMITAFKRAAKISRYSYAVKGVQEPFEEPYDDEAIADAFDTEYEVSTKLDASKVLACIEKIQDEQAQFAMLGHFLFDMSLRDLSEVFGKSHEWVRTYLIEPELRKIREELGC